MADLWMDVHLRNVLVVNADSVFTGVSCSFVGYHVTVDNCTNLTTDWGGALATRWR